MNEIEKLSAAQEEINEITGEQFDLPLDKYPNLESPEEYPENVTQKIK